ncbi:MAG: hypothetical protein IT555_00845 [Acetobacteraceae bacterium]|nr:hypothetical protein [Acetobacteraceae bacterium]
MRHHAFALALLAAGTLPGCTLVDQRTFQSAAPVPGPAEIARTRAPTLPLVSIRMDQPGLDYRAVLAEAVQAAQQRKPDVSFDVLALVPLQAGTPQAAAEQDRRVAEAAQDARTVATTIGAAGISSDRLHLGLRGDAGAPAREVRVYVR